MSERDELRNRLASAVMKHPGWIPWDTLGAMMAADAVLAEIERTHELVPRIDPRIPDGKRARYLLESTQGKPPIP